MQPTDKSGAPAASEPESTSAADPVVVSSDSSDSLGGPVSDPSDPDAAMYAAIAARPDWTTKPAARAALAELSQGLSMGQDLLFWDVAPPRPAKASDATEHLSMAVAQKPAGQAAMGAELPSRRLYVAPGADPRRLTTVRSPGRNGPRPPPAVVAEVTLVSPCGGAESSGVQEGLPGSPGDGSRVRFVRAAVATLVGGLAVGLGLLGLFGAPARGPSAPFEASVSAPPSVGRLPAATAPRGAVPEAASTREVEAAFTTAPAPVAASAAPVAATASESAQPTVTAATVAAGRQVIGGGARPVVPLRRAVSSVATSRSSAPVDVTPPLPLPSSASVVGPREGAPVKTRPRLPEHPEF